MQSLPTVCLFSKCALGCIGHKVTYPKQPNFTTLTAAFHAGSASFNFQNVSLGSGSRMMRDFRD